MKEPKTDIIYHIGKEYHAHNISDTKHVTIKVLYARRIDPAQYLLDIVNRYDGDTVTRAQGRVKRAKELEIAYWYHENGWSDDRLEIEFQGAIKENRFYCAQIHNPKLSKKLHQFQGKILKAIEAVTMTEYGWGEDKLETPEVLIKALKHLKAIRVEYDYDWDRTNSIKLNNRLGEYYPVDHDLVVPDTYSLAA